MTSTPDTTEATTVPLPLQITGVVLLLIMIAGLGAVFIDHHLDRSFITYRYVQHLSTGQGLVYNPGEAVISESVAPFYAVLLSLGTLITPDIPLLSNVIGIVGIALGALALYLMAFPSNRALAPIAAGLYLIIPLLWATLGLETALWLGLGMLAVWMHQREWGIGTAILLGLATLIRWEIALLVVILIADSMILGRPFRLTVVGVYAGIVLVGMLGMSSAFGQAGSFPGFPSGPFAHLMPDVFADNVFSGIVQLARSFVELSWLWVVIPLLALFGLINIPNHRWALLLIGWAVLHILALWLLGVVVYIWNLAPLLPMLAALAALGVAWIAGRFKAPPLRWVIGGAAVLLCLGAAAQSFTRIDTAAGLFGTVESISEEERQVGEWLHDNTAENTRIGTTRIGLLGYASERPLIDYYGSLQKDVADAFIRGDSQWWVAAYQPDYLVLRASELEQFALASDPWFSRTYSTIAQYESDDSILILQRTAETQSLTEIPTGLTLTNSLSINQIAIDFSLNPLDTGRMARVRIEWFLEAPVDSAQQVGLRIQGLDGTIAALSGQEIDFSRWPTRRLITTYHTLELLPSLTPGAYNFEIGIGDDPVNLNWHILSPAKVPFQNEAFLGGLSGTRATFGDIMLTGYRIGRTQEGLEILLIWQAIKVPQADYLIRIQLRDANGKAVMESELEPYGGIYPTSYWAAGEQVADTYLLDVSNVPPGEYDVYAGLLGPDGNQVLTLDDQAVVFVGHLSMIDIDSP